MANPTLRQSALHVASILEVIVRMSDDVKHAASPLDAQGKLLFMQNSIQKNAARLVPFIRAIVESEPAEKVSAP